MSWGAVERGRGALFAGTVASTSGQAAAGCAAVCLPVRRGALTGELPCSSVMPTSAAASSDVCKDALPPFKPSGRVVSIEAPPVSAGAGAASAPSGLRAHTGECAFLERTRAAAAAARAAALSAAPRDAGARSCCCICICICGCACVCCCCCSTTRDCPARAITCSTSACECMTMLTFRLADATACTLSVGAAPSAGSIPAEE